MKVYVLAMAMAGLMLAAGGTCALAQAPFIPVVETPPPGTIPGGGTYQAKVDAAPASSAMASFVMRNTHRKGEWVNIPAGTVNLRTWISYPDGNADVPVVVVLSDVAGMWDDFPRGIADQLAQDGFIGVVPDIVSGKGPDGGNWDSFESLNLATAAAQKLTVPDGISMARAARDYALKLPRANGKSATIGFSYGGDVSFAAAALIPGLNAAVVFDGNHAPDAATMAKITAPVLFFGGDLNDRDQAMAVSAAAEMKNLGKSFQYHIWATTTGQYMQVGFYVNDTQATLASWPMVLKFLRDNTK